MLCSSSSMGSVPMIIFSKLSFIALYLLWLIDVELKSTMHLILILLNVQEVVKMEDKFT
jgi:hypothetical protein